MSMSSYERLQCILAGIEDDMLRGRQHVGTRDKASATRAKLIVEDALGDFYGTRAIGSSVAASDKKALLELLAGAKRPSLLEVRKSYTGTATRPSRKKSEVLGKLLKRRNLKRPKDD